jgi:hypothetical protein
MKNSVILEKLANLENNGLPFYYTRRSFLHGLYGIVMQPLGYGSSYDPARYNVISDANIFLNFPYEGEYIPAHSHIVGAAVYSGFLALPFWLFMIYINIRLIFHSYADSFSSKFAVFLILLSLNNLWAIMFSPFSNRILLAFSVAIYTIIFSRRIRG